MEEYYSYIGVSSISVFMASVCALVAPAAFRWARRARAKKSIRDALYHNMRGNLRAVVEDLEEAVYGNGDLFDMDNVRYVQKQCSAGVKVEDGDIVRIGDRIENSNGSEMERKWCDIKMQRVLIMVALASLVVMVATLSLIDRRNELRNRPGMIRSDR